jgi:hypothetical protein
MARSTSSLRSSSNGAHLLGIGRLALTRAVLLALTRAVHLALTRAVLLALTRAECQVYDGGRERRVERVEIAPVGQAWGS